MEKLLYESCEKMGIVLNDIQIQQFMLYQKLLLQWNNNINLTAITEEREVILKHFVDCVSVIPHITIPEQASVIDVGTGAGFPGIPIKIVCPSISLTLLDSLQKRVTFLKEVVSQLSLQNVNCIHERAEYVAKENHYRQQYDYCVSRAVANMNVLLEYCLPFVKVGGIFAALKGRDAQKEVEQSQKAIQLLGGELIEIKQIEIPHTDLEHKIVLIKKIAQTPAKYPRKAGKPVKSPIQ